MGNNKVHFEIEQNQLKRVGRKRQANSVITTVSLIVKSPHTNDQTFALTLMAH